MKLFLCVPLPILCFVNIRIQVVSAGNWYIENQKEQFPGSLRTYVFRPSVIKIFPSLHKTKGFDLYPNTQRQIM